MERKTNSDKRLSQLNPTIRRLTNPVTCFSECEWAVVSDEDMDLQVVVLLRPDNEGFRRYHYIETGIEEFRRIKSVDDDASAEGGRSIFGSAPASLRAPSTSPPGGGGQSSMTIR